MTRDRLLWAPPPRYLMRVALTLPIVRRLRPQRVLEVGAATGDLVARILAPGMHVTAAEISDEASAILRERFAANPQVSVHHGDFADLPGPFDLIICFAVLEHIPDDRAVLRRWHDLLAPAGHILISVPAKRKLWSVADEVAGHLRRYERPELAALVADSGFRVVHLWNYGFPLSQLIAPLDRRFTVRAMQGKGRTPDELTRRSGIERPAAFRLRFILNRWTLAPFAALQRLFLNRDWARDYLLLAEKRPVTPAPAPSSAGPPPPALP